MSTLEECIRAVRLEREGYEKKLLILGAAKTPERAEEIAMQVTFRKYSSILMDRLDSMTIGQQAPIDPVSTVELKMIASEGFA